MYKDLRLLDWATAIARGGPTWLEIVASHAPLLSASDDRNESRRSASHAERAADEPREWINLIRPEIAR